MKYNINLLPIVPYIIAENACWNVLEADKNVPTERIGSLIALIAPKLEDKFEMLYNTSQSFRQQINNKRKDMRYTTEMFMEHWAKAIYKKLI